MASQPCCFVFESDIGAVEVAPFQGA